MIKRSGGWSMENEFLTTAQPTMCNQLYMCHLLLLISALWYYTLYATNSMSLSMFKVYKFHIQFVMYAYMNV